MREFALVGIWALFAIFIRHNESNMSIAYAAITGVIILFVAITIHAMKNHETNPFKKLKERLREKN